MLEVKLSILEGVNKSMKVPDLIRSCIGICGSSQKTGPAVHSWKGIA